MKPIVHYVNTPTFYKLVCHEDLREKYAKYLDEEGQYERASVYGIDHPYLGEDVIHTSLILKKHDDGSFETMNTIYVPLVEEANEESE